jgi:hypothetical protein
MYNTRNLSELNNLQIQHLAPSALAEAPAGHLTHRYAFFKTVDVVEGLRQAGWAPIMAQEQLVRDENRRGVQKHLIRFHRRDELALRIPKLEDSRIELILTNSHDGTSAYRLRVGVFRLVCLNGLVVSSADFGAVSIRHSNRTVSEVVNTSTDIAGFSDRIGDKLNAFRLRRLSTAERLQFAKSAIEIRYDSLEECPVRPEVLLEPRRSLDYGDNLWVTLNVVHEGMLRGTRPDRRWALIQKRDRAQGVRKVSGIDSQIDLNLKLWNLAESFLAS